jgi:hypothetical protein
MDERLKNLEQQVSDQGELLKEVRNSQIARDGILNEMRDSQKQISAALLGNLEHGSIGLIEQARVSRNDINNVLVDVKSHTVQINDLQLFQRDIKKLVAGIALAIPALFELAKWIFIHLVLPDKPT